MFMYGTGLKPVLLYNVLLLYYYCARCVRYREETELTVGEG